MSAIDAASNSAAFQAALLGWYDSSARRLPWRVPPRASGRAAARADPYRVWLSEIMLQQTVVAAATPYFDTFTRRWPTVEALAAAPEEEVLAAWAGLGYYARARNLIACAREVIAVGGFPKTEAGLLKLPGVGPYTAAAIAAIAFGEPAVVVDGNIERVMARLFAVETPLPAAKPLLRRHAASLTPEERPGDHAQALMDLGAAICRPRAPACLACPVRRFCKAAGNAPERLPVKPAKTPKPQRYGTAYWLQRRGEVLTVRRPPRGLLGGMRAFPASPFTPQLQQGLEGAPAAADWTRLPGEVTHVFTHFRLSLTLARADLAAEGDAELARARQLGGEWTPLGELADAGFPALFDKAVRLMLQKERKAA